MFLDLRKKTNRELGKFSFPSIKLFSFGKAKKPVRKIGEKKTHKSQPSFLRFTTNDQIMFAKRLSMILRSGMPIMEGLGMLGDEAHTRSASYVYESLMITVSNGQPLSTGLEKFKRMFGEFGVNIIKIGEVSGTLHENLEYLADEMKRNQALRRKVIGALLYPALIVAATFGITIMLTVYIFPKIIPIFQSVKAELPWSTKALMAISKFLSADGLWLFLGLAALVVAFIFSMRMFPRFHLLMDRILLRIPLFGKLSQYYNLANICRTTALLLKSDVRIVQAMELVANGTRNLSYRQELMNARERIIKGQKLSAQFKEKRILFPAMMSQMVTVGEQTGNLGGTFSYLAEMYEEEIGELTKSLTTLLEPVLMIIMGGVVGFIAISIITPIYSITQNLTPR